MADPFRRRAPPIRSFRAWSRVRAASAARARRCRDAGDRTAGALRFRAGPVQHAHRLRRRRGGDQRQRRSGRCRRGSSTRSAPSAPSRARSPSCSPGEPIGLRGPSAAAGRWQEAQGRDVIVVAGGLGLAPLRPALYRLFAERERYGRIMLLYRRAQPAGHSLSRRARALARPPRRRGGGDGRSCARRLARQCRRGDDADLARRASIPRTRIAMLCGPEIMMRFVADALRDDGRRARSASISRWSAT